VKSEYKLALSVLIFGAIALGGIYYYKKVKVKTTSVDNIVQQEEQAIMPATEQNYEDVEEVKVYLQELQKIYKQGKAVLPLDNSELDSKGKIAQDIALENSEFLKDTKENGKLLHNDVTKVAPVLKSMLDSKSKEVCKSNTCYVVEKYNFVKNSTTRAIVDVDNKRVLAVKRYENTQPDINVRLTNIAKAIALNNKEILTQWGHKPSLKEISMPNVRTNLQESPCQDKNHLCVAPTFPDVQKQRALWAIVDLTALRLAAAKWAPLGKTYTPACIDERELENRYIMKNYCQKDNNYTKDGWEFTYHLTGSDGLELRDVKFKGKKVAKSLKVVDWHVAYKGYGADKLDTTTPSFIEGRQVEYVKGENNEYTFGYNDAMGCPMFSTSVVLAFNGPQIKPLIKDGKEVGFIIIQDFRNPKWPMACNYRYQNRFEFYKDGSFRNVAVSLGRGCANNAIYRPVMRLDLDLDSKEQFSLYKSDIWDSWSIEGDYKTDNKEKMYKNRYLYRVNGIEDNKAGYYIEPNRGQFGDNSRGDNEHIFVTKFKQNEGDEDMLTLGSCCKLDEDGVEQFVNDEIIEAEDIVLWYVPFIKNDDRVGHEYCWADSSIDKNGNPSAKIWPCIVGPKFVPISSVDK